MKKNKILQEYREYLNYHRKKKSTIQNHLSKIKIFLNSIESITQKEVQRFILELDNTLKESSITQYISILTVFFRFLKKDIELPAMKQSKPDKVDPITPEYLENELIPVVEYLFKNSYLKVRTLLWFMLYTGIRRREIAELKRKDINLNNRTLYIIGKGDVPRTICFPEKVKTLLEQYFKIDPENNNAFNLGYEGIKDIFHRINTETGCRKLYPHLFRHSFAIMLLREGIPIETISRLMGHSDIKTTSRYLKYRNDDITKEIYDKYIK